MDITLAIEELAFDGSIGLGRCSRSTIYRWTKAINEYLKYNKFEWSVKADYKNCCINVV